MRPGNGSLPWDTPQPPAHEIHGISNDDVNRGLPTRRALRRLRRLARRRILVAHNAKFDYGFISSESLRHAVPLRVDNPVCTLELSRKLDPKRAESHRLATLCERYGIPLDNAHDALCDATATARLLSILIKNHGATTVDDLRKISARKAAERIRRNGRECVVRLSQPDSRTSPVRRLLRPCLHAREAGRANPRWPHEV